MATSSLRATVLCVKVCTICCATKPLDDFYRCPGMKDGRFNQCKKCQCDRALAKRIPKPRKDQKIDLAGQRFCRWTVLSFAGRKNKRTMWLCHCDCGTERAVWQYGLTKGRSTSCGCYLRDWCSKTKRTHGWSHHRICCVWHAMVVRCHKPGASSYNEYGARGIAVCERWRNSLQAFIDDMGLPPTKRHSIDRYPNGNGNYEPGNCRWATPAEQCRNTSRNVWITFNGKTQCMRDWSIELGVNYNCIIGRLRRGWTTDEALSGIRHEPSPADRIVAAVGAFGNWP